jgi:ketosteroid isomerase-like protein
MPSRSNRIREVINCDLQWTQAQRDLDLGKIEKILSDSYQQIQIDGSRRTKQELLSSYRSGERRWKIAESSDHRVQISGDLGILIGRWRGVGTDTGEHIDYSARYISIYQQEDDNWRMILDISVPFPD